MDDKENLADYSEDNLCHVCNESEYEIILMAMPSKEGIIEFMVINYCPFCKSSWVELSLDDIRPEA